MATGCGAHRPDDARLVLIVHEQHVGGRRRNVHPVLVDPHQVRLVAQGSARHRDVVAGGMQGGSDQAGVLAAVAGGLFGDLQAALLRQHRGVDHVDRLSAHLSQQPDQRGRLEDGGVVLGNLALVSDGDADELAPGHAGEQATHHGRHGDVGRQDRVDLGRHEGGVDGVAGRLAIEDGQHLLGGLDGYLALGLLGGRAQVRGGNEPGMLQQGQVTGRFVGEHVQGRAGQVLAFQGIQQGVVVDQFAAGDVDQASAGLHLRQLRRRDEIGGAGRQRGMQRDEIGLGEHFIQG